MAGGEKGGTPRRRGGGNRPDRCPAATRRASGGEATATARGRRDLQPGWVIGPASRVCRARGCGCGAALTPSCGASLCVFASELCKPAG